jgi:O-acetyl-ADP-ribose deacetylase (regulator of RNase III)
MYNGDMKPITYVVGDATRPSHNSDTRLVIHCCNDIGGWGRGFVLAVSARDHVVETRFRQWSTGDLTSANGCEYKLGNVQFSSFAEDDLYIANMVGQHGVRTVAGVPPIRYEAIESCLKKVAKWVMDRKSKGEKVSVHAPRFGAGLAGGRWEKIEALIEKELCSLDIDVTVYDLE